MRDPPRGSAPDGRRCSPPGSVAPLRPRPRTTARPATPGPRPSRAQKRHIYARARRWPRPRPGPIHKPCRGRGLTAPSRQSRAAPGAGPRRPEKLRSTFSHPRQGRAGRAGGGGSCLGAPRPRCKARPGGGQRARSGWPEQTKINWLLSELALKMQTAARTRSYFINNKKSSARVHLQNELMALWDVRVCTPSPPPAGALTCYRSVASFCWQNERFIHADVSFRQGRQLVLKCPLLPVLRGKTLNRRVRGCNPLKRPKRCVTKRQLLCGSARPVCERQNAVGQRRDGRCWPAGDAGRTQSQAGVRSPRTEARLCCTAAFQGARTHRGLLEPSCFWGQGHRGLALDKSPTAPTAFPFTLWPRGQVLSNPPIPPFEERNYTIQIAASALVLSVVLILCLSKYTNLCSLRGSSRDQSVAQGAQTAIVGQMFPISSPAREQCVLIPTRPWSFSFCYIC